MRKRIISRISYNLKEFSRDYFYFQLAVALSALAAAIVMFCMRANERAYVIAAVCCLGGAVLYVAKAYLTLMLFYGLGELIDTNRAILKELGGEVEEQDGRNAGKLRLEHVYDAIAYDTDKVLKKSSKIVIGDRFVTVSSERIPFSDISVFDRGNDLLGNYGFDRVALNVYHIRANDRHYYFSLTDEAEEKAFRTDLHERLTR